MVPFFSPVLSLDIAEPFIGRINCKESRVDHNITLAEGRKAGKFLKANSSITKMPQCVSQCCKMKGCDVAFMVNKDCYSVLCKSLESCVPKKNKDPSMSTLIAYVAKHQQDRLKGKGYDYTVQFIAPILLYRWYVIVQI